MKLSDAHEGQYEASGRLSSLAEKLLFAGIGTVLVLSGGLGAQNMTITTGLKWALAAFVVGLGLAGLQYLTAAIMWNSFARAKETELGDAGLPDGVEDALDASIGAAPDSINRWPWIFFWGKVGLAAVGWAIVIVVFSTRVS